MLKSFILFLNIASYFIKVGLFLPYFDEGLKGKASSLKPGRLKNYGSLIRNTVFGLYECLFYFNDTLFNYAIVV